jgi:transposase
VALLGTALPHPRLRQARCRDHRPSPCHHAALTNELSNARVESVNTKLRLLTRIAFGFRAVDALIGLAMLSLGGCCPPLPGRT